MNYEINKDTYNWGYQQGIVSERGGRPCGHFWLALTHKPLNLAKPDKNK